MTRPKCFLLSPRHRICKQGPRCVGQDPGSCRHRNGSVWPLLIKSNKLVAGICCYLQCRPHLPFLPYSPRLIGTRTQGRHLTPPLSKDHDGFPPSGYPRLLAGSVSIQVSLNLKNLAQKMHDFQARRRPGRRNQSFPAGPRAPSTASAPSTAICGTTAVSPVVSSGGSSKLTSCTASCFLKESRRSDRCSRRMTTSSESGPRVRRPASPSNRSPAPSLSAD